MKYDRKELTHSRAATTNDGGDIVHRAKIITYVDVKNTRAKLVSLLTNDMEMEVEEIVEIFRKRWEIDLLFKQIKQNLRYFYGESANTIKIQIWVTLIANLLLIVIQKRIKRTWSNSEQATLFRIMLMSTATRSLKSLKRTGGPYLKKKKTYHQNARFLTRGLTS